MKLVRFDELNKSGKLNESWFEKIDGVKSMNVVSMDDNETYSLYLEVTSNNGLKYYAKLKDEKHFDPDEEDGY